MRLVPALVAIALSVALPTDALSQAGIVFTQKAICTDDGTLDPAKFLNLAMKEKDVDISKAIVGGTRIDNEKLYQLIIDTDSVNTFDEEYVSKKNKYFDIYLTQNRAAPVRMLDVLRRPSAHTMRCLNYPPPETPAGTLRKSLDDAQKAFGKNLLVGKDLDSLTKPLATREPAKLSVTKDGITKNTLMQTEFAVAGYFRYQVPFPSPSGEVDLATLVISPFVTGVGSYNSNDKLKDVDKAMTGIAVDFWSIPIFGLYHGFSARVGYQIDTSKGYEALSTELVYYPPPGLFGFVQLGEKIQMLGDDGPWVMLDLTPRLRYGNIYENATIPTLPASGDFLRAGYKMAATFGFGGDDFLSLFGVNIAYTYFDNIYGGNGISQFERFDAALTYKITDYFGISLSYKRGRDEDQLKAIDQIIAALTFKFGEKPGSAK